MGKRISTTEAPAAIGPYSQAVKAGNFLFISGQLPLDPATGLLVDGSMRSKTERVMANIEAILRAAGMGLGDIVKSTVYLRDMNDFAAMNETYASFFPKDPPARVALQVARLPKDADIEIEAVAFAAGLVDNARML